MFPSPRYSVRACFRLGASSCPSTNPFYRVITQGRKQKTENKKWIRRSSPPPRSLRPKTPALASMLYMQIVVPPPLQGISTIEDEHLRRMKGAHLLALAGRNSLPDSPEIPLALYAVCHVNIVKMLVLSRSSFLSSSSSASSSVRYTDTWFVCGFVEPENVAQASENCAWYLAQLRRKTIPTSTG